MNVSAISTILAVFLDAPEACQWQILVLCRILKLYAGINQID